MRLIEAGVKYENLENYPRVRVVERIEELTAEDLRGSMMSSVPDVRKVGGRRRFTIVEVARDDDGVGKPVWLPVKL